MRRILVLALAFGLVGCSSNSFLGRRYDNFTAYYNTFYNARKAFEKGEQAIQQDDQAVDRNVYLALFIPPGRASDAKSFESAIKKSADVLREHERSKWVDDALLLIGKSYFYLQNYVGAEQKFREVIGLSPALGDEARFWLARSLIAGGAYEEATNYLRQTLASETLSRRWAPSLRLALAELYLKQGQVEAAAQQLEEGLGGVRDRELAARGHFLLGQVLETLGRYDEAAVAFERVPRFNPPYELDFAAQVSAIRVQAEHGQTEQALRRLRRMERDDKHYAYRAQLTYLRGLAYQEAGRYDEAFTTYDRLLYDSDANIQAVRGRVHYALGRLYRDAYGDYVLAAAHFDTAATAMPRPEAAVASARIQYSAEALLDVRDLADTFSSFRKAQQEVHRLDSLLYLGSLDDEAFAAFVRELEEKKAAELAAQREAQQRLEAQQRFTQGAALEGRRTNETVPAPTSGASFLYHDNPLRVQEGLISFVDKWGDRPRVPNWRRLAAISGLAAAGTASPQSERLDRATTALDDAGRPAVDVSAVPRTVEAQADMRQALAAARYEMGNVLFLSLQRPDSAAVWYRLVVEETPDAPVAPRALHALAELQRAVGDTVAAEGILERALRDYPDAELAPRWREQLGLVSPQATSADSLALAEAAYAGAYEAWQRRRYASAFSDMLLAAASYRDTEVAPRALLAAGTIYAEWARQDSLSLYEPIPVPASDSLLRLGHFIDDQGTLVRGVGQLTEAAPPPTVRDTPANDEPGERLPLRLAPDEAPAGEGLPKKLLSPPPGAEVPASAPVTQPSALDPALPDPSAIDPALPDPSVLDPALPDPSVLGMAGSDTTATPVASPAFALRLETLYQIITSAYPQSPQAARAKALMALLEERRPQPPAADTARADTARADTARADTARARSSGLDTARVALGIDSLATPPEVPVVKEDDVPADAGEAVPPSPEEAPQAAPADAAPAVALPAYRSVQGRVDPQAPGGWTLRVVTVADPLEAQEQADVLIGRLEGYPYPVDVLEFSTEEGAFFMVVVGQFSSEAEAQSVFRSLGAQLAPEVLPIPLNAQALQPAGRPPKPTPKRQ